MKCRWMCWLYGACFGLSNPKLVQYIPRNMHTVFALLCFVVVIHWLIYPYPSGLLHWHCGNLTIAPVPAKQPWWIWINTSCEFIMNDYITTTKQSTTKLCAYFLGYTVYSPIGSPYFKSFKVEVNLVTCYIHRAQNLEGNTPSYLNSDIASITGDDIKCTHFNQNIIKYIGVIQCHIGYLSLSLHLMLSVLREIPINTLTQI